nr:LLM class flavin-dependent oxidoreductase [Sinorhizobium arboris]
MVAERQKMILGLFMRQGGHHEGGWRHPTSHSDAGFTLDRYRSYAAMAEAAAIHFVFVADSAGVRESTLASMSRSARVDGFEPLTLMAALSVTTDRIGLVATASTTFNEPYHIARKFASIDHLSGGRAGWNIVTSTNPFEAENFNLQELPLHEERYARAEEFVSTAKGLWDSFADDAFIRNRDRGLYLDPARINVLDHRGEYFKVRGPLNISRCPQGYPVLAQAGSSQPGARLAARHGELVFTAQQTIEDAKRFYDLVKGQAVEFGRSRDALAILPGIVPIVAKTDEAAEAKLAQLQSLIHEDLALELARRLLGYVIDLDKHGLDERIPDDLIETNNMKSRQKLLMDTARARNYTIRQLAALLSVGRGHLVAVGSPARVVDQMQEYFEQKAADGFVVMPAMFPSGLEDFVHLVIPELRRRDLFRTQYCGKTLRENLGFSRPPNIHFSAGERSDGLLHH